MFLLPTHIDILATRCHMPPAVMPKLIVPELIDVLDELEPSTTQPSTAAEFLELCAITAALEAIKDHFWDRRQGQTVDFDHLIPRAKALTDAAAVYAKPFLMRDPIDRHAAAYVVSTKTKWANLRDAAFARLHAGGWLRRGRFDGEANDRAFVVGFSAPIRLSEDTSDDQGRWWPRYRDVPDLLALPADAYLDTAEIAALPALEPHHAVCRVSRNRGDARPPSITRHTENALRALIPQTAKAA